MLLTDLDFEKNGPEWYSIPKALIWRGTDSSLRRYRAQRWEAEARGRAAAATTVRPAGGQQ